MDRRGADGKEIRLSMPKKVYIVGAGPGPADLLTARAAALLGRADVVLHDDLVTPEILALAGPLAEVINVGKRCGRHGVTQERINALLVWHAENGKVVVRLKSGDPAVFGRLGEELDALRRASVDFEVVPGITAASAAAAAAGITLTDRRRASALVVLTGHTCGPQRLSLEGVDPQRSTFAVYMPGPDYGRTARDLTQAGVDCNTPCALVSNAGRASQQVCFMSVADLPFAIGIQAPALLIVGAVAGARTDDFAQLITSLETNHDPAGYRTTIPAHQ